MPPRLAILTISDATSRGERLVAEVVTRLEEGEREAAGQQQLTPAPPREGSLRRLATGLRAAVPALEE